ncbi:hypothetical protein L6164_006705 [Bauhinia variegata]|uniref:Uncharacterized protein n=1 Tax=Bauhinia variegata TaxID=167791 RepID=A0ACB9PVT0_BAUVA|nr:hypothetical protein L6164_006705 [Bauhinia variegata]
MDPPNNSLKIHELCRIAPISASELSLPLTFFDLLWFKLHPVQRLFFYSLPHSNPSFFFESLIPKLKRSLSLALKHFLPLAGNIVWPLNSQKPVIQYTSGDGVSLVIAESSDDFNHFSGNSPREAIKFRHLVPHLDTCDSVASVSALQVTLFPNKGFCIGISTHHAVLDGKSATTFMKSWAYFCQTCSESSPLLPELQPFFDRSVVKDTNGLDVKYLNEWNWITAADGGDSNDANNEKSLKILLNTSPQAMDQLVLATFDLNRTDLEKIKKRVMTLWDKVDGEEETHTSKPSNLSTFILTSAYVFSCVAKALKGNGNNNVSFGFSADCRARLKPPLPANYFGNCVFPSMTNAEAEDFDKEDGLAIVAKKIHNKIRMLEKGVLDEAETVFSKWKSMASKGTRGIGVGGSTRFGVYGIDFGWGRPVKVEIVTIDTNGLITMAESKDGNSGVEVGLLLSKHEMDRFASSFHAGLEKLD